MIVPVVVVGGGGGGVSGFLQGARVIVGRDLVESCHCGHGETCCMLPVRACPEIIEYLATQLSLW